MFLIKFIRQTFCCIFQSVEKKKTHTSVNLTYVMFSHIGFLLWLYEPIIKNKWDILPTTTCSRTLKHTVVHINTCYRLPVCKATKKPQTNFYKLGVSHYALPTPPFFDQSRSSNACNESLMGALGEHVVGCSTSSDRIARQNET